jgi:cellulose synthase/poly-beta-1,6-N-acetylglucosamine synthase-like glycosyltransferase
MIILISLFTLGHILFYAILAWKWQRMSSYEDGVGSTFSVIIPARNEALCIEEVIRDLQQQTYDKSKYEVIVVDDFSLDKTREKIQELIKSTTIDLKLVPLVDPLQVGKKNALTKGIQVAKNEIILTTDADCRLGDRWIESYSKAFSKNTQIVTGPVLLKGSGFFSKLQMTEFVGLIAFGGVTLSSNNPCMCSGANMGFRKEAFVEVGGYLSNIQIPSGDDEFLLFDIMKRFPQSGRFLKSREGIVITHTQASYTDFLNQRFRWISKWKHNKNWKLQLTAILFFIDYFLILIALIGVIFNAFTFQFFGMLMMLRFLSNYLLLKSTGNFLEHKLIFLPLVLLQIIYPFHVLFMGLLSIFGRYTWKGRKY